MKRLSILGSTGSIGVSALDVIAAHPREFAVTALAAGRNVALMKEQIDRFKPKLAAMADEEHACKLRSLLGRDASTSIVFGDEGYKEAAVADGVQMVLSAIVGAAGLLPTLEAISAGKDIALANKETMVMAGGLVLSKAAERGVNLIPVDSEHSAIFQCLQGNRREDVRRIILTASGGPFLNTPIGELSAVTPSQALCHPNWTMGKKITIDSATMMNKGLEVIEAHWLFGIPMTAIDVVIHRQSIVHSLVEYQDGSVMAQLGLPDMRTPIAYAFSFPRRLKRKGPFLDLMKVGSLEFTKPDMEKFPLLGMAFEAARRGGVAPAVLNGANEVAVEAFIAAKIGFMDISHVVKKVLSCYTELEEPALDMILAADRWARDEAKKIIKGLKH